MVKKTAEQLREELARQRASLRGILLTSTGKEALAYLAAKFGGDVFVKGDDSATMVRVGERRVIDYLIDLKGEE